MSDIIHKAHDSIPGCQRVILNRAAKRNSLSRGVIEALTGVFLELASNRDVKVIVLEGDGPAFCAGHDLKELTAHRQDDDAGAGFFAETMQACAEMMKLIVRCPKPVIARVQGIATAAGCQLVASCDLAVAGASASFATPGVNLGLFCSTPMVALSRNLGRKHAMEMLLLGDAISAERAVEMGLVNKVVEDGGLDAAIDAYATQLASKPAYTMAVGKEGFYRQLEMGLDDAYAYVSKIMVENMLAEDAKEGIGAFIEKRAPVWPE